MHRLDAASFVRPLRCMHCVISVVIEKLGSGRYVSSRKDPHAMVPIHHQDLGIAVRVDTANTRQ